MMDVTNPPEPPPIGHSLSIDIDNPNPLRRRLELPPRRISGIGFTRSLGRGGYFVYGLNMVEEKIRGAKCEGEAARADRRWAARV